MSDSGVDILGYRVRPDFSNILKVLAIPPVLIIGFYVGRAALQAGLFVTEGNLPMAAEVFLLSIVGIFLLFIHIGFVLLCVGLVGLLIQFLFVIEEVDDGN